MLSGRNQCNDPGVAVQHTLALQWKRKWPLLLTKVCFPARWCLWTQVTLVLFQGRLRRVFRTNLVAAFSGGINCLPLIAISQWSSHHYISYLVKGISPGFYRKSTFPSCYTSEAKGGYKFTSQKGLSLQNTPLGVLVLLEVSWDSWKDLSHGAVCSCYFSCAFSQDWAILLGTFSKFFS